MKNILEKRTAPERAIFTVVFVLFTMLAISIVYPFCWLFINSLKTDFAFRQNSFALPERIIFANYYNAMAYSLNGNTIVNMFFNSFINLVGIVSLGLFFSCCTAYVLSKYNFRGREFLFNLALIIMIVPTIGSTAVVYKMWNVLHIYDTYFSVFFMASSGFGTGFLLLYATFKNVSWTYAEAAFIDGSSHFRVFFEIMLPQVMPTVISILIITSIGVWNDYYTPFMYLPTKPTIAVGLYEIQSNAVTKQEYTMFFALMLISVLPIAILFVIMQNTIMENVVSGGIKG